MDENISFLEMDMAKKICKSKFWQEVGGPHPQKHIQKVGNPQSLENSYIWSKGVVHIRLPQNKTK
jgi:hypothetical protein